MPDIAIRVENLSKRYRIGLKEEIHDTFAGVITSFVRSPIKNIQRLRRLSRFEEDGRDPEDVIWALKDVSFEVKRGEVLGIIGRNGAGKSTLLKILSKITYPTTGRVELHGRVSSLLEVGTGFHPELTGRENIYLNGTILGMTRKEIDRKYDEIVDFSGVEKFIDTPVKRYSSGMRVRLAFSVAAHLEPEILLIDEVLAVGDAEFQKKCLGKMGEVAQEGRTVLFVSHNMATVSALCSKSIWLNHGKLRYSGITNEIIELYLRHLSVPSTKTLKKRIDRIGDGLLRFTELRIENSKGEILSVVNSGKEIKLVLGYETRGYETVNHVKAGVMIYNQLGEFIFMLKSELTNGILNNLPGRGYLICHIPQLPLSPGQYQLKLWAKIGNSWTDKIDHAGILSVVEGDFFGTGKLPVKRDGILVKHSWKFRKMNGNDSEK